VAAKGVELDAHLEDERAEEGDLGVDEELGEPVGLVVVLEGGAYGVEEDEEDDYPVEELGLDHAADAEADAPLQATVLDPL